MSIINYFKNLLNNDSNLQQIYSKIDKMDKGDNCLFINSSEGLTEEEFLAVLKNEFL